MAPGRALDLAGGEGRNALWLAAQGWRATVVDFSQVALDRARELASQRLGPDGSDAVTTVRGDLLAYRPQPQAYDVVLVVYLHLPAEQRRAVLQTAAAAVASGGMLVVVAHDTANLAGGVGGPQDPAVLYTAGDAAADIAGSGLSVERSETVRRPVEGDSGPRDALDALLVARRSAPS